MEGRHCPPIPLNNWCVKRTLRKDFSEQSLKSVPAFPLSPNGGEGQGEGEVVFTEEEIRYSIYEPLA
jgi:hypothetical protein